MLREGLCAELLHEQAVSKFLRDVSGALQGLAAETQLLRERCVPFTVCSARERHPVAARRDLSLCR